VYLTQEAPQKAGVFRFLHVSTDEVFGSLDDDELPFDETSVYDPSSPYSASKAASDHLVRAWGRTYGLSVLLSNLSNSYGPFQYPDKLIPRMITYAIDGMPLPVYGTGENRRDWLHVEDGARALEAVLINGAPGQRYLIGGRTERRNIDVVKALCGILDRLRPRPNGARHADLVRYITDRPGHDFRYAMDTSRMTAELGWAPARHFEAGLEETVRWYLHNEWWWRPLRDRLRDEQSQFVRRMPI
jgi:dTDP-glucose 4,6-dehydratase